MLSCLSSESFENSAQETENKYFVFFLDTEFVLEEKQNSQILFSIKKHIVHIFSSGCDTKQELVH